MKVGGHVISYTAIVSAIKTVFLASGESLYGTAPLDYYVSGFGGVARTLTAKWQYSVAGANSWNDFAAGVTGSSAYAGIRYGPPDFDYVDGTPGSVAVTQTKSSLTSGNYDVRLVAFCSATGRTLTPDGVATVEAKL